MFVVGSATLLLKLKKLLEPPLTAHLSLSTPTDFGANTVLADFGEPTDPGYAPVILDPAKWAYIVSNGVAYASYPVITFTATVGYDPTCYFLSSGLAFRLGESDPAGGLRVTPSQPLLLSLVFIDLAQ